MARRRFPAAYFAFPALGKSHFGKFGRTAAFDDSLTQKVHQDVPCPGAVAAQNLGQLSRRGSLVLLEKADYLLLVFAVHD